MPVYSAHFACQCSIDGKPFMQGVGKTKKEAKTRSATIAFEAILAGSGAGDGVGEDDDDDDGWC